MYEEAYDCFYRASWSYAWHTASYFQLASMDCMKQDYVTALEHVGLSLSTNTDNMRAVGLKAYALRQLGKKDEAKDVLAQALDTCKIDLMAQNELYLLSQDASVLSQLKKWMLDDVQQYLELSFEYAQMAAYGEATAVLERLANEGNTYPMLYYTLGYYAEKQGNKDAALAYYKQAAGMPSDYCYPFRWEDITVLEAAMTMNPEDAKAPYYLGNLYFEYQPQKAVALWEKSLELDDTFYITWRNLALAYDKGGDKVKALEYMNKAFDCNNKDARLLFELDELNDANRLSPEEKYRMLKKNERVVKQRPETVLRLATRAMEAGHYEDAIDIMDNNFIIESEGAREQQDNYLNSYLVLAMQQAKKGRYEAANRNLDKALAYPIGLYGRSVYAKIYYTAGMVAQRQGDEAKAKNMFNQAVEVNADRDTEAVYYRAMALKELGKDAEAKALLEGILANLGKESDTFFSQFGGSSDLDTKKSENLYFEGLANEGLGNKDVAKQKYQEALKLNPANVWSKVHLEFIE